MFFAGSGQSSDRPENEPTRMDGAAFAVPPPNMENGFCASNKLFFVGSVKQRGGRELCPTLKAEWGGGERGEAFAY